MISHSLFFCILAPPKIVDITIESNTNGILIENEQVILKCLVRGIPQPTIRWNITEKKSLTNKRNDRSKNFKINQAKHFASFLLDIITFDNKLLIRNFSRTSPMDYQCIADNGIPPRDTRSRHLVPASKHLFVLFLSNIIKRKKRRCHLIKNE